MAATEEQLARLEAGTTALKAANERLETAVGAARTANTRLREAAVESQRLKVQLILIAAEVRLAERTP